jgi:hypothetical protein
MKPNCTSEITVSDHESELREKARTNFDRMRAQADFWRKVNIGMKIAVIIGSIIAFLTYVNR